MSEATERLVRLFLMHRQVTQELADRMPDDRVDFKPWDGAKTFGELVTHMATAHRMFVTIARGETWRRPDPASLPKDLPAIRALLRETTEKDVADIRNLSDEQLDARVTGIMNLTMPASSWLHSGRDHEIHHKGQLFVYVRMNGVEPPFFVQRG